MSAFNIFFIPLISALKYCSAYIMFLNEWGKTHS